MGRGSQTSSAILYGQFPRVSVDSQAPAELDLSQFSANDILDLGLEGGYFEDIRGFSGNCFWAVRRTCLPEQWIRRSSASEQYASDFDVLLTDNLFSDILSDELDKAEFIAETSRCELSDRDDPDFLRLQPRQHPQRRAVEALAGNDGAWRCYEDSTGVNHLLYVGAGDQLLGDLIV